MEETKNKSANEIADEEKKKKEQEAREKEAERRRIKLKAEEIAPSFVRIGGTWFKKCQNADGEFVLERYPRENIIADWGKKLGPAIMEAAAKCVNITNRPSHLDYVEYIRTASGDYYYNKYRPLKYKPLAGTWSHINNLIHHIFGEQYELGLDYIQLIYMYPMRRLPILVLVSHENGTGKSTFCNLLACIFGDNAIALNTNALGSRFNSSWADKIIGYCEETLIDSPQILDMIKNYATAENVPTEAKGKDMTNRRVYIKLILCSNNEERPTIIDKHDTRHWVRKVPVITEKNPNEDFKEELKKEIPAFLHFLTTRQLSTRGTDRLWFLPEETRTDAWRRIVARSKTSLELGIVDTLIDIMDEMRLRKIMFSATDVFTLMKNSPFVSDNDKRKIDRITVRDILRSWGLEASRSSRRYDLYAIAANGQVEVVGTTTGKAFVITKELLKSI